MRYTYIKSTKICELRLNILNKAFLEQTKFLDLISPVVCHCSWLVSAAKKRAVWDISYVIYVPSFLGSAYHHHRLNWDYPDISWCTFQVLTGFKTLKTVTRKKHALCIFRWMFYKKTSTNLKWFIFGIVKNRLARPELLRAETGFSGSGTPGAEYGSEASRTVWRVALDFLLFPGRAWEGFHVFGGFCGWVLVHIKQHQHVVQCSTYVFHCISRYIWYI